MAVFADPTGPTHAARQLADGRWSSKLGRREDIEHVLDALAGVDGDEYGQVVQVLKRATGRLVTATSLSVPIADGADRESMAEGLDKIGADVSR